MRGHPIGLGMRVEVDDLALRVRGALLHADVPRSQIRAVRRVRPSAWAGVGVRLWRGSVLANSRFGEATLVDLHAPARVRVLGVPVRARRLVLGVRDPDALVADLGG